MEDAALARAVIAKLRSAGHLAYLVGGCVRDLLLGVRPKDYDIATDARPDRIMDLFPNSGRVGAHFGVVLVRDVFSQVEVATFRSDQEYSEVCSATGLLRAVCVGTHRLPLRTQVAPNAR